METLKVIKYLEEFDCHLCEDERGRKRRIDLIVSGCLSKDISVESLVGKTVNIDYTHPFLELAEGVNFVD